MSLAIATEKQITLAELAQRQKVSVNSVFRWTLHGIRGVALESLLIGGRRYTSEEAFARFLGEVEARRQAQRQARQATPTAGVRMDPLQEARQALESL